MKSYTGYENSKTDTTVVADRRIVIDPYALENESQERIMNDSPSRFDETKMLLLRRPLMYSRDVVGNGYTVRTEHLYEKVAMIKSRYMRSDVSRVCFMFLHSLDQDTK